MAWKLKIIPHRIDCHTCRPRHLQVDCHRHRRLPCRCLQRCCTRRLDRERNTMNHKCFDMEGNSEDYTHHTVFVHVVALVGVIILRTTCGAACRSACLTSTPAPRSFRTSRWRIVTWLATLHDISQSQRLIRGYLQALDSSRKFVRASLTIGPAAPEPQVFSFPTMVSGVTQKVEHAPPRAVHPALGSAVLQHCFCQSMTIPK